MTSLIAAGTLAHSLSAWQQLAPCAIVLFAAESQRCLFYCLSHQDLQADSEQYLSLVLLNLRLITTSKSSA